MIDAKFWSGKTVFITGHTGFKGGWLAFWLHQMGAKVFGYALPPPPGPSFFEGTETHKFCQSTLADIANLEKLSAAIRAAQPEVVFHMAAQPLVRSSYKDPVWTYQTNVMGTVNLLECVRNTQSVRSCVVVTTDKCYENKEWIWGYRENDRLGGHDPYSNSKACCELVTSAFQKSYFNGLENVGLATARAGNVIGGGDFAEDRLIPDLVRSKMNQTDLVIRYPQATRPWQHVLVPLSGYIELAQSLYQHPKTYSQAYNFGPVDSDCISVGQVLARMEACWGERLPIRIESTPQPHEAKLLKLDISKAEADLKWKPVWKIDKTSEMTALWYKEFLQKKSSMDKLTEFQIQTFEKDWLAQCNLK